MLVKKHRMLARHLFSLSIPGLSETFKHRNSQMYNLKALMTYNLGRFVLEISPAPHSMLEIWTQSMDTNFYPNIELGGRGDFSNIWDQGCSFKSSQICSQSGTSFWNSIETFAELINKITSIYLSIQLSL